MEIVITMAGEGRRFKEAGYRDPKFMIEVGGRSLFEWSMDSLKAFRRKEDRYTFIVRKDDKAGVFIREKCEKAGILNVDLIEIEAPTDGQATTAMLAAQKWRREDGLYIYNIDTYVEPFHMTPEEICGDGFIPCFNAPGTHWSFVRLAGLDQSDFSQKAVEVREKQRISDNCTLGAYYFSSCALYEKLYNEYYSKAEHLEKGEKYVAPLYNHMIGQGMAVYISLVPAPCVHVLGTPAELEVFKELQI